MARETLASLRAERDAAIEEANVAKQTVSELETKLATAHRAIAAHEATAASALATQLSAIYTAKLETFDKVNARLYWLLRTIKMSWFNGKIKALAAKAETELAEDRERITDRAGWIVAATQTENTNG